MLHSFLITPLQSLPSSLSNLWIVQASPPAFAPVSQPDCTPLLLSLPHRLVSLFFCRSHISPVCVSSVDQLLTALLSASYWGLN